jgi:hypothetical protein
MRLLLAHRCISYFLVTFPCTVRLPLDTSVGTRMSKLAVTVVSVLTVWVHTFPATDEQFVQPVNLEPIAAIYAIVFQLFIALKFENKIVGLRCLVNDPVV